MHACTVHDPFLKRLHYNTIFGLPTLKIYVRSLASMKREGSTIGDVWEATVDKQEAKIAVVFHRSQYSFRAMDAGANRVAIWAARDMRL